MNLSKVSLIVIICYRFISTTLFSLKKDKQEGTNVEVFVSSFLELLKVFCKGDDFLAKLILEDELISRIQYLEKLIIEKKKNLKDSPAGKLRCNQKGNNKNYYYREKPGDRQGRYLRTSERPLAVALAQKDYDQKIINSASQELHDLNQFLKSQKEKQVEDIWESLSTPRRELVMPICLPDKEFVEEWLAVPYEKKPFAGDSAEYFTAKGERVRSKSEIIIADTCTRMDIPYRYEFPLELEYSHRIHPDFTVLNVRLRKVLLWEHFGMMDDPEYVEHAMRRLDLYERNGYLPGRDLLITHETKIHPLRTKVIEKMIDAFLI